MTRMKAIVMMLVVALFCCSCISSKKKHQASVEQNEEYGKEIEELETELTEIDDAEFIGELGSATEMEGTTVIVSIFADDATTAWGSEVDFKNEMLRNLGFGMEWLVQNCANYDTSVQFIYDWSINEELAYEVKFDENMVRCDGAMYSIQREYILENINSEMLLDKYNGTNIIYMFFFNTEFDNEVNPWSLRHTGQSACDYEIINVFCRFDNLITPPATMAHEVLHCFGAYDLYYASEAITQEFVDYCEQSCIGGIMYTVNMGDEITTEFTELTAYYVGLVDECDLVDEWGLAKSEHLDK